MNNIKKVCAIHDISGIGRCSLTVIIPALSSMGIQVCPVPTAVFSAHTGYHEFIKRDLTDFLEPALEQYKKLKTEFDCIYSGFLGSEEQIDHVLQFLLSFKSSLKVVDPVMGDNGKRYKTVTENHVKRMTDLVKAADIITPNITEAAILLGEDYPNRPLSSQTVKSWAARLSEIGPDTIVITSVVLMDGTLCNIGFDKKQNSFWKVPCEYVPAHYSGSGDLFSSVLVGGILKGDSLPIAINRATSFTELAIKTTYSYMSEPLDGIMLEKCLSWLTSNQTLKDYKKL